MKTMQEILDLALESKLYISHEEFDLMGWPLDSPYSYYMCDVLDALCDQGIITQEELLKATSEIIDYINSDFEDSEDVYSLESFLEKHSLPSSHEDKVKIYKNWDLRPKIALLNGPDMV